MKIISKVSETDAFVQALTASKRFEGQVVYHTVIPSAPAVFSKPAKAWPEDVDRLIRLSGIRGLYRHQAEAVDIIRSGRHLVLSTPTASGKTLVYTLPVFENILERPDSKALYIFPLKALAQDQLRTLNEMAAHVSPVKIGAAIYDGDTSAWHRRRIREAPPSVILTNPEMIHLSLLPHHRKWAAFFPGLEIVVVDEVHTYRGLMGSHMAQVFRRFQRICSHYGSAPTFVFCSATVSNPSVLTEQLTGLKVESITRSGAPQGRQHLVFVNPVAGPAHTAILLLKAALHRGLRTIVYTQSRKLTELIAIWAGNESGPYAGRISAYRAGFLPEERREIEARMANGDLLAVISTSALELGIDIGDLDLCILVGYPGTVVSTLQRGGRVGRSGQDSALVLIAGEDALDQYFMRNPEALVKREPEAAVINPHNPEILAKHLVCAAAELPLTAGEPYLADEPVKKSVQRLETGGELLRSADGEEIYSGRRDPHRHVNLRGTGSRLNIICSSTGESRGEIDAFRAFKETHPGAVYLHRGETYLVEKLDLDTMTVAVSRAQVEYYTRVRSHKNTEILEVLEEKPVWGTRVFTGRLQVTDQVTGYEKWRIHTRKRINVIPLDLPPLVFETEGVWFAIPREIQKRCESKFLHFMGGIHAIEHAAIGMFPLLVMTDRNDLGGIATPFHPQVGSAAIFIYDGVPGGAGLSRQAFQRSGDLLSYTLDAISACPCESGCPSCVHSPKCGSGNRPIDKSAACFLLENIKTARKYITEQKSDEKKKIADELPHKNKFPDDHPSDSGVEAGILPNAGIGREMMTEAVAGKGPGGGRSGISGAGFRQFGRLKRRHRKRTASGRQSPVVSTAAPNMIRFGVLDVETRRSAQEVGGWDRADLMGISCAVLYDSAEDRFFSFMEDELPRLIDHLGQLDLVVGFNIKRFDFRVLGGCSDFKFSALPVLDILEEVHKRLGYRLSLDHLANVTLGRKKTADGLQALRWWKAGKIQEIIDYCTADVAITRDLFLYGKEKGYLLFQNKAKKMVRVPVSW
ncbi:MAG: DEAD/DEAH box helicase [Pseudomonadota bacterium]